MFIDSHLPGTLNLPESWWVKYHIWPLRKQSNHFHKITWLRGWTVIFFFNSWNVTSAQTDETPNGALGHEVDIFNPWALSLFCSGNARFCIYHFLWPGMESCRHLWIEKGLQFMVAEQFFFEKQEWSQPWVHGNHTLTWSAELVRGLWYHRCAGTAPQPVWAMGALSSSYELHQVLEGAVLKTLIQQTSGHLADHFLCFVIVLFGGMLLVYRTLSNPKFPVPVTCEVACEGFYTGSPWLLSWCCAST